MDATTGTALATSRIIINDNDEAGLQSLLEEIKIGITSFGYSEVEAHVNVDTVSRRDVDAYTGD